MIEGLKVTVAGTELKDLCESRAKFHDERVRYYTQQKEALPDADETTPADFNVSKAPQQMMSERIKSHRNEASELRFIAAHLQAEEKYLLDRMDLQRLGFVSDRY